VEEKEEEEDQSAKAEQKVDDNVPSSSASASREIVQHDDHNEPVAGQKVGDSDVRNTAASEEVVQHDDDDKQPPNDDDYDEQPDDYDEQSPGPFTLDLTEKSVKAMVGHSIDVLVRKHKGTVDKRLITQRLEEEHKCKFFETQKNLLNLMIDNSVHVFLRFKDELTQAIKLIMARDPAMNMDQIIQALEKETHCTLNNDAKHDVSDIVLDLEKKRKADR
jgi:hypothetical protein